MHIYNVNNDCTETKIQGIYYATIFIIYIVIIKNSDFLYLILPDTISGKRIYHPSLYHESIYIIYLKNTDDIIIVNIL